MGERCVICTCSGLPIDAGLIETLAREHSTKLFVSHHELSEQVNTSTRHSLAIEDRSGSQRAFAFTCEGTPAARSQLTEANRAGEIGRKEEVKRIFGLDI